MPLYFLPSFLLCRLWDYLNTREENTLDVLDESWENDLSTSPSIANVSDRDWFWLNYEPDIDELDFL